MKQVLIRIPDDLHARLTEQAKRDGVSVNALANRVLNDAVPAADHDADEARRSRLRRKARDIGVLVELPAPPVTEERFAAALEGTKGRGPVLDDLWAEGR